MSVDIIQSYDEMSYWNMDYYELSEHIEMEKPKTDTKELITQSSENFINDLHKSILQLKKYV